MKMNNKSGFTLLEIIIVIIIVGVLASLALPRFFSTIEFSRSTEALNNLGVVRKSIERCALVSNSVAGCNQFNRLDITNPALEAGSHFSYGIQLTGTPTTGQRRYVITATRNTLNGGDGTSFVRLTVDSQAAAASRLVRSGSGVFASIN